ncbi:DUF4973 domain-containing protein [Prevotella sp. 10(H)]|uniref:DUF4973 domain-containing protein n=1 Tax=Prevotella sp. 10(H) TaxID=1158294 RepID=UPI0004A6BCA9|nr:DUF4973 domain-containing protein [Prevotella sp. 10(H)]
MKKLYIYIVLLSALFAFHSCNDDVDDELYTQMVGLKAPIHGDGVSNVYLRYKPEGIVSYNLPVVISGTQKNKKDLEIKIGVDNDTLPILNQENFANRTDLYYRQLDEKHFSFPSPVCKMPSGSSIENYVIDFNLGDLDMVDKWVLPLTIQDDPSYISNMRKGWRKALLYIRPFNDYSGNYSATNMFVYYADETNFYITMNTRQANVVSDNTVFFYVGVTEELDKNRGIYKILATFENGKKDDKGVVKGNLTVRAENSAIGFKLIGQPTYEIREEKDAVIPYLLNRYITLNMEYRYNDITKVEGDVLPYRAKGSMVYHRKINTLIPDEDQAIVW